MSEKTTERRWRINSRAVLEVLYEGRWETAGSRWAYPDNGHNQRFREAVADACGDIDALTSERDEAVRVAGELRAALREAMPFLDNIVQGDTLEGGGVYMDEAKTLLTRCISLTASTGGSSEEPQKEIRE